MGSVLTIDTSEDVLRRCVKRVRDNWDAKYSYYDGERELLECGSGGGAAFKNLYGKGIDEILRRIDTTNNWTLYYQQDQLGNVTELTWGSGDVVEIFQYDAFGALNKAASGWGNPFLFTGRRYQSTFGIYEWSERGRRDIDGRVREGSGRMSGRRMSQYRARAYHPRLGRFTSEDPKLFDAGDYNLFRYCHNDPLDLTDPMGLWEESHQPRTYEQLQAALKAREHALGYPGHGAIEIGKLHYAAGQLSQALGDFSIRTGVERPNYGTFQQQHIVFDPNGTVVTSAAGNPITQGTVIYYVDGKPVASYPANSGGFKSKGSLVAGNDTRTPPGHYLGKNLITGGLGPGMTSHGIGFALQLNPLFYTNRSGLYVHPDGRAPGTQGCIGISCGASGLRDFQNRIGSYLSRSPFIDVYVGY